MPGPDIVAILARSLAGGWRASLFLIAGIVLGHVCWMLAVAMGLTMVLDRFGVLFIVIRVAGVIYLLWMAWSLWHTNPSQLNDVKARADKGRGVLTGLAIALGNPNAMVFFGAIMPLLVDLETLRGQGLLWLLAASALTLVVIFLIWSLIGNQIHKHTATRHLRRLYRVTAIVLVMTCLWVLVS